MKRLFSIKSLLLFLGLITIILVASAYVNKYSSRSKATQPAVNVSFSPATGSYNANEQKALDIILQPQDSANKISGIDLKLSATGNVQFIDVNPPSVLSTGDTSIFASPILKNVANQEVHVIYTSSLPQAQLPNAIKIQVLFKGTDSGSGNITVDSANTTIVGNIPGNNYALGTLDTGAYTFSPSSVSPTATLTPTPMSTTTCMTLPQNDIFGDDHLGAGLWDNWNSSGGVVTQDGLGQLKVSVPSGNGYAGVITKNKVCGDFDVRVDFSGFTTSGQSEADARLSIEEDVGLLTIVPSTVFVERFSKGNSQGLSIKMVEHGGPVVAKDINFSATAGKLRIRRIGAVYTLYYDDGSGWKSLGGFNNGFTTGGKIAILVKSFDQNPSVSASFDNFNLTAAIPDPSPICKEGVNTFNVRETCSDGFRYADYICYDSVKGTLGDPSSCKTSDIWNKYAQEACAGHSSCSSPLPTPPSGTDKYTIDIGTKQSLSINIGAGVNSQIKFKAKLASLRSFPDLYLKLRVKDELAFTNNPSNTNVSSCNNAVAPDKDFYIPVRATGDVYSPVQQISATAPTGAQLASVTPDGWVILDGVVPGRYYSLYLKGPKTRKSKVLEHFLLQPTQASQDFDWTGKPLDPGDLPNPNKDMKQDCTINSVDWSLVQQNSVPLEVGDVNYDGIVNSLDSIDIIHTLDTRPDDDQ